MNDEQTLITEVPAQSVLTVAHIVYALHTTAIVLGISGAPTIIGSFLGSLPSILAVILNYVQKSEAGGTWAESHYRWQIRTFWFALLWFLIAWILILTMIGIPVGMGLLALVTIWLIYRVARGWLRLGKREPMYAS